ncbi:Flp family type IVb pilin [Aquamicrobium sp. LC103]|uniref:Flp family type IVb pilin n=1 Tax=Aquamicrobium sp. LC103 TaxID=1120658 RepID=UPI00109D3B8B|nr:Flp family type IVb pilin [Aquamicrobium sp. LC103]TKT75229.1 Flp family type IVb pilin [Aquamicrobium sp. LC103]
MLRKFLHDENGTTAIEYALIAMVLSLAIIGGVGQSADAMAYLFGDNSSRLNQALNR